MYQTNIPNFNVPFVDVRTGMISQEWWRYLVNQFQKLGGTNPTIPVDQQQSLMFSPPRPQPSFSDLLRRIAVLEDVLNAQRNTETMAESLDGVFAQLKPAAEPVDIQSITLGAPAEPWQAPSVSNWL